MGQQPSNVKIMLKMLNKEKMDRLIKMNQAGQMDED
jgi:hypothetical protein